MGGFVHRLSCRLAIASKECHENHVMIVGCHFFATEKRGDGDDDDDTVVLRKIQLLT